MSCLASPELGTAQPHLVLISVDLYAFNMILITQTFHG